MRYAIIDGERTEASPGERGLCPGCENQVLAKCGPMVAWHWSHAPARHCDPWWENETDWHRTWKGYFPAEWQEVFHVDSETGERHIADVKTPAGMVLEFQHSPMELDELQSRESFYGDMLWVVDGARFSKNLHIANKLPPPDSEIAAELVTLTPPGYRRGIGWRAATLVRKKDELAELHIDGLRVFEAMTCVRGQGIGGPIIETTQAIEAVHEGHYLLVWNAAPPVWLAAERPVLLDIGQSVLIKVEHYSAQIGLSCRLLLREAFVRAFGGGSDAT